VLKCGQSVERGDFLSNKSCLVLTSLDLAIYAETSFFNKITSFNLVGKRDNFCESTGYSLFMVEDTLIRKILPDLKILLQNDFSKSWPVLF
jgi:hypothetical protein